VSADPAMAWERPGPGSWTFDGAHNIGPVTPVVQEVFPGAMADGFRSFTARYGLPISHIDVAYVNGYAYTAVRVAGVPVTDRPPPPAPILRLVSRLAPELRRRNRVARQAMRTRPWRDDLDRWFTELRPARLAAVRAIQAVEPSNLTDAELADHLVACVDGLRSGVREHFGLVGAAGLPVGLHLQRETARERSDVDALADLRGAASRSTAATVPALAAIADALAVAGTGADTAVSLADVRSASPRAATALDAYLDEYGQRIVGAFDVTGKRLIEAPELVLRSIAAATGRSDVATMPVSDDVVIEDARLAIASRDDHAGICCMWPLGLLRRAMLAVGERLAADGRLAAADLALEARSDELVAALTRGPGAPPSSTLAWRGASRLAAAGVTPPPTLGPMHAPPDPAVFPAGLRATSTAMAAFLGALETVRAADGSGRGVGIGTDRYRGRAVVAADPEDALARLEPGDVLVTGTTTPAFNTVLVLAGALVTAHGGPMSHAGIVARELGLPAVVGLADALDRIPDGAEVEVDPVEATVQVIAARV
jgi:phosphohistidine swiveling domain-containing protein